MTLSVLSVPGIEQLNGSQLRALHRASVELGIQTDWLATVISFETGKTFSPSVLNKAGSGAFGLIQFMPSTAAAILGYPNTPEGRMRAVEKGRSMSFNEQLEKMVIPYFRGYKGRMNSLNDVYLAVFYPAAMRQESSYVIGAAPSAVYTQNIGFDKAGKGYVTRADVTATITNLYNAAYQKVRTKIPGPWLDWAIGVGFAGAVVYGITERKELVKWARKF